MKNYREDNFSFIVVLGLFCNRYIVHAYVDNSIAMFGLEKIVIKYVGNLVIVIDVP